MRIIRHTAPDMRHALRAIRERLGDDAVILSSRRVLEGVEVTAAIDFDAAALAGTLPEPQAAAPPAPAAQAAPTAASAPLPAAGAGNPTELPVFAPAAAVPARRATPPAAEDYPELAAPAPASDLVGQELRTLRRMLETQLAQLAWSDLTRRAPVRTELLRELTEIGLAQDLAERIAGQLPAEVDLACARRFAITGLSQYLLVAGERWIEDGGRIAFIGATGVGKSTTLAKVAVRWVLRHGPRDLALVAADNARIGAQDQLQSLGQLLGAPVYVPDSFAALPALLERLAHCRLVLIDTPGASLRDERVGERLTTLAGCASQLETALVLAASTQAGALEEAVRRFSPAKPACCVLTKIDEAASLGGALSVLIRARLPVAWVSEGQRVPEDLQPARALDLVSTAVRLAKASGAAADEDLLSRRFGKVAHGA